MFITCQECNTTFRLDERLLKPTGSKVRCSQCLHTFIAMPILKTRPVTNSPAAVTAASPEFRSSAIAEAEAHELEGIDLAELDAMLEGDIGLQKPSSGVPEKVSSQGLSELDDLDLNSEFEAALQPMENTTVSKAHDLEDMDLSMDFEIEDEGADSPRETPSQVMTAEPKASRPAPRKASQDDFGMALDELDLLNEEDKSLSASPAPESKKLDDLDLADFDLDLNDTTHAEDTGREEPELSLSDEPDQIDEGQKPELSLSDEPVREDDLGEIDLSLSEESDLEEEGEELELSLAGEFDLEKEIPLPSASGSAREVAPVNEEIGLDLGNLDLELDTMSDFGPEESSEKSDDDLDFSELDSILGTTSEKKTSEEKSILDEIDLGMEDAELSLDMDEGADALKDSGDEVEEGIEDLEFELDSEFENAEKTPQDADEQPSLEDIEESDEIDLSDIEEMLGDQKAAGAKGKPEVQAVEDLSLTGDGGEIDLAEIESAIDQVGDSDLDVEDTELELELELDSDSDSDSDGNNGDGKLEDLDFAGSKTLEIQPEEFDLDLELELESNSAPIPSNTKKAVQQNKDELDLSDLADLVGGDDRKTAFDAVSGGDIDLEFQIEGNDEPSQPAPSIKSGAKMPAMPMAIDDAETLVVEEKKAGKAKAKPKPKRSSRTGLVLLLILLLVAGVGYGLYYAVTQMGMDIPYLSEYLNPPPADPRGNLNLSTLDINSKFIENGQSGRLFVITGKVRNGYNAPRTTIRLQGKLFSKGKVLVKNEFSYAGTIINDQELATLSISEIKQRLNQDVSGSVRPGQNTPFMLVFSDLPPADQLDEFAVEMVSSAAAGQ